MRKTKAALSSSYLILLACIFVFSLGQFHRASGAVFGPILIDENGFSATALGALVATMFAATLLFQVPAGIALDRFGPHKVLIWAIWLVTLGTTIFAVAPLLQEQTMEALVVSRFCLGAGLAATGAGVQLALAHYLPARDYGYASGLLVTLGGIGGLLGTWPLAAALAVFPWVVVFGTAAMASALLVGLVARGLPRAQPNASPATARGVSMIVLLRNKNVQAILCMGAVTYAPIVTITGLWGGPYLQDVHGLAAETTGQVLMFLFATTIAAGFVFGHADRLGFRRRGIILGAAVLSAGALAVLAVMEPSTGVAVALLGASIFFQQFYIPLGVQLRDAVPGDALGRANSLLMITSIGAIPILQICFGAFLDFAQSMGLTLTDGYRLAFGGMALLIASVSIFYLARYRET